MKKGELNSGRVRTVMLLQNFLFSTPAPIAGLFGEWEFMCNARIYFGFESNT